MTEKNLVPALQKEVSPVVAKAQALEITDAASMAEATAMLSTLNRVNDEATDSKEKLTKPLNAALKEIRSRYKPLEDIVGDAIDIIRGKMTKYQTEAKRIADKAAADIAGRVGEGKGHFKSETAVKKIAEIERPPQAVATAEGVVKFKTIRKFEVMDMALLPMEYHLADEVAIRKAMMAGTELTGVRYYTEQVPENTR